MGKFFMVDLELNNLFLRQYRVFNNILNFMCLK